MRRLPASRPRLLLFGRQAEAGRAGSRLSTTIPGPSRRAVPAATAKEHPPDSPRNPGQQGYFSPGWPGERRGRLRNCCYAVGAGLCPVTGYYPASGRAAPCGLVRVSAFRPGCSVGQRPISSRHGAEPRARAYNGAIEVIQRLARLARRPFPQWPATFGRPPPGRFHQLSPNQPSCVPFRLPRHRLGPANCLGPALH